MRTLVLPVRAEIDRALGVAVDAAEAAGALLRERACSSFTVQAKGAGDVVTDLDLASERLIIERITAAFPTHQIVAEEAGVVDPSSDDDWVWLVDPLDGTNNIAMGLPAYVVGVALCHHRDPVVGVVHDPIGGKTYTSVRGGGAFGPHGVLSRAPLPRPTPHGPVIAWTQGHAVGRDDGVARALKLVLDSTARRVLQLWAPLLSWVMLARGDIDGIIGYQAEGIDLPAGLLIAAEAGMEIRAFDGEPFDQRLGLPQKERSFVAGHPEQVGRLLDLVNAVDAIEPTVNELLVSKAIPVW
jgi:myo-inositol-1(or 4)-monophosphatase